MSSAKCHFLNKQWDNGSVVSTPVRATYPETPPSFSKCTRKRDFSPDEGREWNRKDTLSMTSSCDRFIPNRRLLDTELSNFLLRCKKKNIFVDPFEKRIKNQRAQQTDARLQNFERRHPMMADNNNNQRQIENEEDSPPTFERFYDGGMFYAWSEKPERRLVYRQRLINAVTERCNGVPKILNLTSSTKANNPGSKRRSRDDNGKPKLKRFIPRFPEKILDLPRIFECYGSNVMDWDRANDCMAVSLGTAVYTWHPITKKCHKVPINFDSDGLVGYDGRSNVVALAWNSSGNLLAMASENRSIVIWDKENNEMVQMESPNTKRLCGHKGTTVSLVWKAPRRNQSEILYLAHNCKCIWQYFLDSLKNVQISTHYKKLKFVPTIIKLSSEENFLGCGSNTGELVVLDTENDDTVVRKVAAHDGMIKALAWCPWQNQFIATGGSTNSDHFIRIWNVNNGSKVVEVDGKALVCSLVWSEYQRELISGHGGENNYVLIWKYPCMEVQFRLIGHKSQVLYLGIGLGNSLLATVGEDETLLLWRCFDEFGEDGKNVTPSSKKSICRSPLQSPFAFTSISGIIR